MSLEYAILHRLLISYSTCSKTPRVGHGKPQWTPLLGFRGIQIESCRKRVQIGRSCQVQWSARGIYRGRGNIQISNTTIFQVTSIQSSSKVSNMKLSSLLALVPLVAATVDRLPEPEVHIDEELSMQPKTYHQSSSEIKSIRISTRVLDWCG